MKPLVYIAGPYTNPDPVANTNKAVRVGMHIYDSGLAAVLIPHLTLAAHLVEPRDVDTWYRFDLDQLAHVDGVYRMHGASTGADCEVAQAVELGIPVYHAGLIPDAFDGGYTAPALRTWLRSLTVRKAA